MAVIGMFLRIQGRNFQDCERLPVSLTQLIGMGLVGVFALALLFYYFSGSQSKR